MTRAQAAVVDTVGAPFTLQEIELDRPHSNEVVVRLVAAGLCHTDLSVQAGHLPFPLPGVLGHEGAGVVEAVGAEVTRVRPGDHVVLSFTSCGHCQACGSGHPAYCATWAMANVQGRRDDGSTTLRRGTEILGGRFFGQSSFATRSLCDERSLVRVDPAVPLHVVAPLGCGVQTGIGTVLNVLRPRYGSSLAVFGSGAVGLSSVIAATWTHARTIIAVDRVPERLELAGELGATHTVDAAELDVTAAIAEITSGLGVDCAVETTGNTRVLRHAVDALAVRGSCAVVGVPPFGTEVSLDVNGLLAGRRVVGVTEGDSVPESFIPFLVAQYQAGRLPLERLITEFAFSDIEDAARSVLAGETIKPVLRFDTA